MKDAKPVTITLPQKVLDDVKTEAKKQDISLSCLIRHTLKDYLDLEVKK